MLQTPHAGLCARCLLGVQVHSQLITHQIKRSSSIFGQFVKHSPGLRMLFKATLRLIQHLGPVHRRGCCVRQRGRRSAPATRVPAVKVCHLVAHLATQGMARPSDGQIQTSMDWFTVAAFVGQK